MAGDIDGMSPHISKMEDDHSDIFDASNLTAEEVEDFQKLANKVRLLIVLIIRSLFF